MIGRTQLSHWTEGDVEAARHLLEKAGDRLRAALVSRDAARKVIAHERLEIRRRQRQLSQAEQHQERHHG